jgi:hypothetical protein
VQTALDHTYGGGVFLLVPVPTTDTSLFPSSFPSNAHPIVVQASYDDDIRMVAFQIDGALLTGQVYAPYVRRPNSKPGTILTAEISGYLAGENYNAVAALVPSLVSTIVESFPTRLGLFDPADAAYQPNSGNVLSNKVASNVLPNPISGPGVYPEVLDMQYSSTSGLQKTTAKLFKATLNQPSILAGVYLVTNTCQRNQQCFNNATGVMYPRVGNVTLGPAADGATVQTTGVLQRASPDGSGVYSGLEGFSACAQNVGFNAQDCDEAAKDIDPTALQVRS